jgi:hypothetical protein
MRNAMLVLAALAAIGCGQTAVRSHASSANGASGPAFAVAAPHGAASGVRTAASTPQPRPATVAVNRYRGTTEPAKLRPCKIQLTSEMQVRMNGMDGRNKGPKMKINEISVPCSSRCPGQRQSGPPTRQVGPHPSH